MDSATLIQSVLQGISLAVVCDVVRDFLVLRGNKINLEKLSKYDGCVVKDLLLPDSSDIEKLKKSIDSEILKQFLLHFYKLELYSPYYIF